MNGKRYLLDTDAVIAATALVNDCEVITTVKTIRRGVTAPCGGSRPMGKRTRRAGARAEKSADLRKEDRQFAMLQSSRHGNVGSSSQTTLGRGNAQAFYLSLCF